MSKPAARIGDMHVCPMVTPGTPPVPHVGGPVSGPGVPTVLICGMPAAVMGDMCTCVGPPDTIVLGSVGVLIGGKPAARMGDMCAHGGTIAAGAPTVLVGEVSPGAVVPPVVLGPMLFDLQSVLAQALGADSPMAEEALKMAQTAVALQQAAVTGEKLADPAAFAPRPPTPCERLARMKNMSDRDRCAELKALENDVARSDLGAANEIAASRKTLEMGMLSNAAYDPENRDLVPPGYERVSPGERASLGLPEENLAPDQQMYKRPDGSYVMAFRGTDTKNNLKADIVTDVKQGLGFKDPAYTNAEKSAKKLALKGVRVEYTGHSKGGGQAAFASSITGSKATTFNAAGVHEDTLTDAGLSPESISNAGSQVQAFHNARDPLSLAQNNRELVLSALSGLGGALATVPYGGILGYPLKALATYAKLTGGLPKALGTQNEVSPVKDQGWGLGTGHSMDTMLDAMKQQQDARLIDTLGCNAA